MHQLQRIGLLGLTIILLSGFWAGLWYQGQRKGGATVFATGESGTAAALLDGDSPEIIAGSGEKSGSLAGEAVYQEAGGSTAYADREQTGAGSSQAGLLAVHVVGQVASPGLYFLPPGSRIYDAVMEAEPEEDADLAKINMAMPVEDGMQIRIPVIGRASSWDGEALVVKASDNRSGSGDVAGAPSAPGKININTATAKELETLPGIGPAYSQRIIQYREQNGGFRSIEDLMKVKGIGAAKMSELRDKVCSS